MPADFQPSRQKTDLAEVVEMLLDKGIVINADIAVSIGDTQLLGVQVRAAIASFETAAKYGLEFPEGTDMRRVAEAVGEPELAEMERPNPAIDPTRGVNVTADEDGGDGTADSDDGSTDDGDASYRPPDRGTEHVGARPDPDRPTSGGFDLLSDDSDGDSSGDGGSEEDASSDGGDENGDASTDRGADESTTEPEGN